MPCNPRVQDLPSRLAHADIFTMLHMLHDLQPCGSTPKTFSWIEPRHTALPALSSTQQKPTLSKAPPARTWSKKFQSKRSWRWKTCCCGERGEQTLHMALGRRESPKRKVYMVFDLNVLLTIPFLKGEFDWPIVT